MLTGINFSPPLYFLFNFCLQLIFPTSIEQLRIQSLIFIIIGIVLSFLLTRNIFGTVVAFFATMLIVSQSNLLFSQAQEARNYAMFFTCGAWVLYLQSLNDIADKKYKWLTFLSHFCLCQVHYLGIIFSFLSGVAHFLTPKNKEFFKADLMPISLSWLVSIVSYLFYLSKQKSVLNTWPKTNELSDLLSVYNDSLQILTILIPVTIVILRRNIKRDSEKSSIKETDCSKVIIITSFLWIFVPSIFWILSIISPLNLFVGRYFIPKESALIILIAYGLSFILQNLPRQKSKIFPIIGTFTLSVILILISTKRAAFGLNKKTNYHHSLIINESNLTSDRAIILKGDPSYFPNAYLGRIECSFSIENELLVDLYQNFSSKINVIQK